MAHLTLLLDSREVRKFVLNRGVTTIGRAQDNDIVINNLALSRRHAQVEFKGGRFEVVDLQSQNGVYVNQERIRGGHPLDDHDSITLGTYQFIFRSSEDSEPNVKRVRPSPRQESTEPGVDDEPAEAAEASAPLLVLKYNDVELQRFAIRSESSLIGRAKECDVQIPERRLSRKHCEIRVVNGRYQVDDLGSQNGTYVNRKRIKGVQDLHHGDVLNFAEYSVLFLSEPGSYQGPDAQQAASQKPGRPSAAPGFEKEATSVPRAYRDDDRPVRPSEIEDPDEASAPAPPISASPKASRRPAGAEDLPDAKGRRRPEPDAPRRRPEPEEPRRKPDPEEPRRKPEPEAPRRRKDPEDEPRARAQTDDLPAVRGRREPEDLPEARARRDEDEREPIVKSPTEARQKRRVLRGAEPPSPPRRSEPAPSVAPPPRRSHVPEQVPVARADDVPSGPVVTRSKASAAPGPSGPGVGRAGAVRVEALQKKRPSVAPRRVEESDIADPDPQAAARDEALDDWYEQRNERSEIFDRPEPEPEDDLGPADEDDEPNSLLPPRGQSSVSQVLSQMMVGRNDVDTNLKQPHAKRRRFSVDVRHHDKLLYSGPLTEAVTILGTDREADIKLKGRYVAGRHSILVRVRDSLLLVRLGSSSAARVNGLPKLQAFLKTGDVIQIDETTITVTEE